MRKRLTVTVLVSGVLLGAALLTGCAKEEAPEAVSGAGARTRDQAAAEVQQSQQRAKEAEEITGGGK